MAGSPCCRPTRHRESKTEFADLLRRWHDDTREETIGDLRRNCVTKWLTVSATGNRCVVHADTSRVAIRRYLELVAKFGPDPGWRVERGRRETLNKVCVEPDGSPTPGLFIYTARTFGSPTVI
jgi:hypothetical protein